MNTISYEAHLNELLKDPEFKKAYENAQPYYHYHRELIRARLNKEISQKDLSVLSGIDQGNLSKLEQGLGNPSIKLLRRLAQALDMDLVIQFVPKSK